MNVTNLKENYQNLLSFMAEKGYKESTINCYRHQIQWILDHAESREWTSYKDIYLEYASYGYSFHWLRGKEPCSVHWNGLTCLGNILTENITSHFFQRMLMSFWSRSLKNWWTIIQILSLPGGCRLQHSTAGQMLHPGFFVSCRKKVAVPLQMPRKTWCSHFSARIRQAHRKGMITYTGSGRCWMCVFQWSRSISGVCWTSSLQPRNSERMFRCWNRMRFQG